MKINKCKNATHSIIKSTNRENSLHIKGSRIKLVCIIISILFIFSQSKAQNWNLVWSDEFDSTSINSTNWTYDIGGNGWGNSELEYYTNRPDNAKVENGNLLIIAKEESYDGNNYTSARLKTQGLRSFTYGKIEARIKIPVGQGLWPAFWMLGQDINTVGWPECGEIDIMEHINNENLNHGTMHWNNNGHVSYGGTVYCDESTFHIYSIEWDANAIKWLLDGNEYWEGNIANDTNSTEEFHLPLFIIFNLAVGGNWPGNPNNTTTFPDTMYVDYVKVYQLVTNVLEGSNIQNPNHFFLSQNYPNPFNPSTDISFTLPSKSLVTLKVFDIMGREVATLFNGELSAGNHNQRWNAANMSSGVYFYRLSAVPSAQRNLVPANGRNGQTGTFEETKKLILMK